jgi:hypothetical protein
MPSSAAVGGSAPARSQVRDATVAAPRIQLPQVLVAQLDDICTCRDSIELLAVFGRRAHSSGPVVGIEHRERAVARLEHERCDRRRLRFEHEAEPPDVQRCCGHRHRRPCLSGLETRTDMPSVTVVAQDPSELGTRAALLLFARIDGETAAPRRDVVRTRLITRGSGEIHPV